MLKDIVDTSYHHVDSDTDCDDNESNSDDSCEWITDSYLNQINITLQYVFN